MSFDPDSVRTVTFDSYSTLVDVDAVETALADRVDDPEPISRTWRERSLQYTFVGTVLGTDASFYDVNRDALEYAMAAHGIETTPDEREEILSVYHDLEPFDDVRESLERLDDAGYDLYVLSNGTPEMLSSMVDVAAIDELIEDAISAYELPTFKPDADLYRHAAGRTGTPIDRIAHVSAMWFDVQGAIEAGMQGVWIDRKKTPWEPFGPEPDLIGEGLEGLVELLT
ncbi:haloacid dehalogenase type II [Natronobacterium texcoconense]|uniref:2-haloacid dehalogenase n=1 Tax=Natronobacterium texcoconense TaxID=1095778 RepID=A0A1H1HV97_NATTX|nr:haloacid dehalogenase type II [Natronobacterium texcoconense]SDR29249.1 2-haloacid dehalogenase [Natronobacterium texcoconense]